MTCIPLEKTTTIVTSHASFDELELKMSCKMGVRVALVEDPSLGILAATCHWEENALHNDAAMLRCGIIIFKLHLTVATQSGSKCHTIFSLFGKMKRKRFFDISRSRRCMQHSRNPDLIDSEAFQTRPSVTLARI